MPIDFIILGIFFIYLCFNYKKTKFNKTLILLGLCMILLGYFNHGIFISRYNVSINFCNLFGIIFVFVFCFKFSKINGIKLMRQSILILLLYMFFNFINLDNNIFFNCMPLILIVGLVNICNVNFYENVFTIIISMVFVEIFNLFFMLPKIDSWALFSREFIFCIVVCCGINLVLNQVIRSLGKIRNEKVC